MNVLEKILEEIEEATFQEDAPIYIGDMEVDGYVRASRVKEIIRSRMDEAKDTNVHINDDPYILLTINENGVAEEYDDTYDITIHCESEEEQDRVSKILENYHGWIPVEEKLPEVQEGLEDMYCPEFNVTIKGAKEATTLKYSWDGTWFDDNGIVYSVIAWQPLPEAYHPKQVQAAEHIMSRFTRVE